MNARRWPLASTLVLRQTRAIRQPGAILRVVTCTALATVLALSADRWLGLALAAPAFAVCVLRLRWGDRVAGRAAGAPWRPVASPLSGERRSGRRRWFWFSVADLVSAMLVLVAAAWETAGLPSESRLLALVAAVVLLSVVGCELCLNPRWYVPELPGGPVGTARALAGPLLAAAGAAITLPAPWPPGQRTIVALLSATMLCVGALTRDQDLTTRHAVELIRAEAQDGRQVVLDELHGALSANLRLLEQAARELRAEAPRLYELAVSSNARLREIRMLADPARDTADDPSTLAALVGTLALAVGARAGVTVRLGRLDETDRDLVRLALTDLIGLALAQGAAEIEADIGLAAGRLVVCVTHDAPVGTAALDDLDPLRERLVRESGTVSATAVPGQAMRSRLQAAWPARSGTG